MKQTVYFTFLMLLAAFNGHSQSIQKGPYTVTELAAGVFHIEDANDSNPAGVTIGDDGQMTNMNNCSDMYLLTGSTKALLIDLSNEIKWDSTATESLRSIVYERSGNKELLITVTHKHGDHLGMLPAFKNDQKVTFWIPKKEFEGRDIFPSERTHLFDENASLDLGGGLVVNTMEVSGHTAHSTLFFLKGKNLVFTGDAIGSGNGVWLFNEESFYTYKNSIDKLIAYIENPSNSVNIDKLQIYGGHFWQGKQLGQLTSQYIYDMRTLINEIGKGTAKTEEMSAFIKFLDTNFKYGTATISWNKEAAERYSKGENQ
ncbi:MAG TPA: MBL fold metallo-hydrolase [Draconibacterium sp.]|nr:MBL fold metallo-hydrolase [Draconibacterium sp.]